MPWLQRIDGQCRDLHGTGRKGACMALILQEPPWLPRKATPACAPTPFARTTKAGAEPWLSRHATLACVPTSSRI